MKEDDILKTKKYNQNKAFFNSKKFNSSSISTINFQSKFILGENVKKTFFDKFNLLLISLIILFILFSFLTFSKKNKTIQEKSHYQNNLVSIFMRNLNDSQFFIWNYYNKLYENYVKYEKEFFIFKELKFEQFIEKARYIKLKKENNNNHSILERILNILNESLKNKINLQEMNVKKYNQENFFFSYSDYLVNDFDETKIFEIMFIFTIFLIFNSFIFLTLKVFVNLKLKKFKNSFEIFLLHYFLICIMILFKILNKIIKFAYLIYFKEIIENLINLFELLILIYLLKHFNYTMRIFIISILIFQIFQFFFIFSAIKYLRFIEIVKTLLLIDQKILFTYFIIIYISLSKKSIKEKTIKSEEKAEIKSAFHDTMDNIGIEFLKIEKNFKVFSNKNLKDALIENKSFELININDPKENHKEMFLLLNLHLYVRYFFENIDFVSNIPYKLKQILIEIKNYFQTEKLKEKEFNLNNEKFKNSKISEFYSKSENTLEKNKGIIKDDIKIMSSMKKSSIFKSLISKLIYISKCLSKFPNLDLECKEENVPNVYGNFYKDESKNETILNIMHKNSRNHSIFSFDGNLIQKDLNSKLIQNDTNIFILFATRNVYFDSKSENIRQYEEIYLRFNRFSKSVELMVKKFSKNKIDSKFTNKSENSEKSYYLGNSKIRDLLQKILLKTCHEFRNPLMNIIEMTKMIKSEQFKKEKIFDCTISSTELQKSFDHAECKNSSIDSLRIDNLKKNLDLLKSKSLQKKNWNLQDYLTFNNVENTSKDNKSLFNKQNKKSIDGENVKSFKDEKEKYSKEIRYKKNKELSQDPYKKIINFSQRNTKKMKILEKNIENRKESFDILTNRGKYYKNPNLINYYEELNILKKIKFLCNFLNFNLFEMETLSNLIKTTQLTEYVSTIRQKSLQNLSEFNIYKEISKIAKIINAKISLCSKNLKFTYEIEEDFPSKIIIDCEILKKILFVLINNSIKFTKNGIINLSIKKSVSNIIFELKDEGIGIKLEDQPFIGDIFYKPECGNNEYGIGIGFFLFKTYLNILNGIYQMKSVPGKGTFIKFTIPLSNEINKNEFQLMVNNQSVKKNNLNRLDNSSKEEFKHTMTCPLNFKFLNSSKKFSDKTFVSNGKESKISKNLQVKKTFSKSNLKKNSLKELEQMCKVFQSKKFIGTFYTHKKCSNNFNKDSINNIFENSSNDSNHLNTTKINEGFFLNKIQNKFTIDNINKWNIKDSSNKNLYHISNENLKSNNSEEKNKFDNLKLQSKKQSALNIVDKSERSFLNASNEKRNNLQNKKLDFNTKRREDVENYYEINYNDTELNMNFSSYGRFSTYNKASIVSQIYPGKNIKVYNILIVDDEELIRKSNVNFCKKYFEKNGKFNYKLRVDEASDGIEGLYKIFQSFFNGFKYDIIITDETMNFMKGSYMAEIIKKFIRENIFNKIQIGLMTSYDSSSLESKQLIGFFDVVGTKPINTLFMDKLFNLCGKK